MATFDLCQPVLMGLIFFSRKIYLLFYLVYTNITRNVVKKHEFLQLMFLFLISYEDESVACAGREFAFIDKELLIKVYLSLIFLLPWPVCIQISKQLLDAEVLRPQARLGFCSSDYEHITFVSRIDRLGKSRKPSWTSRCKVHLGRQKK